MLKKLRFITIALILQVSVYGQDQCQSNGWANYDGQTYAGPPTGGGNASVTKVTTFAQLKSAVESSDAKVIHAMNSMGNGYKGTAGDVLKVNSTVYKLVKE